METNMDRKNLGKPSSRDPLTALFGPTLRVNRGTPSLSAFRFKPKPNSLFSFLAEYPDARILATFWLDDNRSIIARLWNFNESYRRETGKISEPICENEGGTSFKLFIRFIFYNHVPIWNFHWSKNFRNLSLLFGIHFDHSCADHFSRWDFR